MAASQSSRPAALAADRSSGSVVNTLRTSIGRAAAQVESPQLLARRSRVLKSRTTDDVADSSWREAVRSTPRPTEEWNRSLAASMGRCLYAEVMNEAVSIERPRDPGLAPRVLIVEDDPAVSDLLVLILEERGYEVTVAPSGCSALEAARQLRPHVITLDLGLPDLDGQAVLDRLSADAEARDVPVVVVSAFAGDLRRTPQVFAVLAKPFDLNCLLETIAAVVRTRCRDERTAHSVACSGYDLPKAIAEIDPDNSEHASQCGWRWDR